MAVVSTLRDIILIIWISLSSTSVALVVYSCPQIAECTRCDEVAIYETRKFQLIPPTLGELTKNLTLVYLGRSANITTLHFKRFIRLEHLHITGPIQAIEKKSFLNNCNLLSLQLKGVHFRHFPNKLFCDNNTIRNLSLIDTRLDIYPGNIFDQLENLKLFRLSSVFWGINTPGMINGYGKEFQHMTQLEHLELVNARPFSYCPSRAHQLFSVIPTNITSIIFRKWRANTEIEPHCILNSTHLSVLSQRLRNSKNLDLKHSDLIFGHSIYPGLFEGFHLLSSLNIGRCRISVIRRGTFDSCPNLTDLVLDGNPLGPRVFDIYSPANRGISGLEILSMKHMSISSDQTFVYHPSRLLPDCPNLKEINLSNNILHRMPYLLLRLVASRNRHKVKKWIFDNNDLENLYPLGRRTQKRLIHCPFVHDLTYLSFRNNVRLNNIESICPTVTHLLLDGNHLYDGWDNINSAVIKSLVALEVLDLSNNKLTTLTDDLMYNMRNLTELYLTGNKLTQIAARSLIRNTKLQILNLRQNNITYIEWGVVRGLPQLRILDLSQNSLITLQEDFIDRLLQSQLGQLYLRGNKFNCVCNENQLQGFLKSTNIVPSAETITCVEPVYHQQVIILDYRQSDWHCKIKYPLYYTMIAVLTCMASACLILPCYKYWWFISHLKVVGRALAHQMSDIKHQHKCEYDAYVSYNRTESRDGEWIVNVLIPAIEEEGHSEQQSLKLYIEDRIANAGSEKHTERCRAMEISRKIIVVVSNSYLMSSSCLAEADLAGFEMFGNEYYQPNRILTLVREELDEDFIKPPISSLLLQNVLMVCLVERTSPKTAVFTFIVSAISNEKTIPPEIRVLQFSLLDYKLQQVETVSVTLTARRVCLTRMRRSIKLTEVVDD